MKLATKLMLVIVGLALLVVALSGYLIYSEGESRWKRDLDQRLVNAATAIADVIDQEALMQLKTPADLGSPAYQIAQKPLHEMLMASSLDWAGIYYLEQGQLYYWLDDSDSGVGYPFFYATPAHFTAYETQQVQRVEYTDEFGVYYGYVAPILKAGSNPPETLGLVEVVISGDSAQLLQESIRIRLVVIIALAVFSLVLLAYFSLYFAVSRPLKRLRRGAMALSRGDFTADVTVWSRDELYDLSIAFRQLVDYMRYIAQAADRITQGDLSGNIQPRSEKDLLGVSFVEMAAYLSRLSTAASQIADGNLDGEIILQSERDVLGKAFRKMTNNLKEVIADQNKFNKLRATIWKLAAKQTVDEATLMQELLDEVGPVFNISRVCYFEYVASKSSPAEFICKQEWRNTGIRSVLGERIPLIVIEHWGRHDLTNLAPQAIVEYFPAALKETVKPVIMDLAARWELETISVVRYKLEGKLQGLFTLDICHVQQDKPVMTGEYSEAE